ncbi:RNA polymerase sigma factor [Agathobaculum desmolans]|uniref:RNA polymerase sigma factor n=1 Tax=Agathobaculum desmolans TaxID=39484 RepID=UPI0004E1FABF|nr:sigma-70 family RNA polymerase sigma factor [Agathobaculum desmolans]
MDDKQIIDLYWDRSESAISETANKYSKYCNSIAFNILHNNEDSEECVNDTYMRAWAAIPPQCPNRLSTFLGKITRNLALNRYDQYSAAKRGYGQMPLALEELQDCIPSANSVEQTIEDAALVEVINRFLADLPADTRKIFMRRYWYLSPIKEIADDYNFSESKVKMILLRSRNKLKQILEKEDIAL